MLSGMYVLVAVPRQKYRRVTSSTDRDAASTASCSSRSSEVSGMPSRDFSSSTEQYRCPRATVVTVHVPATASLAVPVPSHRYVQVPVTVQATFAVYVPVDVC